MKTSTGHVPQYVTFRFSEAERMLFEAARKKHGLSQRAYVAKLLQKDLRESVSDEQLTLHAINKLKKEISTMHIALEFVFEFMTGFYERYVATQPSTESLSDSDRSLRADYALRELQRLIQALPERMENGHNQLTKLAIQSIEGDSTNEQS